jgi:hypothetical protein
MDKLDSYPQTDIQRRKFLEWVGLSGLALALPVISFSGCQAGRFQEEQADGFKNIFDLETLSRKKMGEDAIEYLNGGADDLKTVNANLEGYDKIQIRARALIDVSNISTKVELFGQTLESPIILVLLDSRSFFIKMGKWHQQKQQLLGSIR